MSRSGETNVPKCLQKSLSHFQLDGRWYVDILLVLLLGCDEMSGLSHLMFDIYWTLGHFMTLDIRPV